MTVSNQVPSASSIANGATTVFPFSFYVAQESDLIVRLSGVEKVLNVDYSVVGAGNDAGGTVVMAVAPANGVQVDILRNTPLERDEDFQTSGDLPAGELNRQLDRIWQALQDINLLVDGSGFPQVDEFTGDGVETEFELTYDPGTLYNLHVAINGGVKAPGDDYTWSSGTTLTTTSPVPNGATLLVWYQRALSQVGQVIPAIVSRKVLSNDGTDLVWDDALTKVLDVLRYGAVGDGATDDTAAIQAALTAADGGVVLFPPGKYRMDGSVTVPANTTVIGRGATVSLSTSAYIALGAFQVSTANVRFEGLAFDLGKTRLPAYASYPSVRNAGIYANGASNLQVHACRFTNLYTQSINFYNCNGFSVTNCYFSSPAQTQNTLLEHIWVLTCSGNMTIRGNEFINSAPASIGSGVCGVFASGTTGPLHIDHNRFDYCGRDNTGSHRLGVIDLYGNSTDVHVHDNRATNCMAQFMRVADVQYGYIRNNNITYAATSEVGGVTISIESTVTFNGSGGNVGCRSVKVADNTFVGGSDSTRYGVTVNSYDYGVPSTDIEVSGNTFSAIATIVQVNGPFDNVRISRNSASGTYGAQISQRYTGGGITITSTVGTQSASAYKNLYIVDNVLRDTGTSNRNGVYCDMTTGGSAYSGTIGQFDISRNKIYSSTANSSQAISVNAIATANTANVYTRDNELTGYAYGLYVRNALTFTYGQNSFISIGTANVLQSGNTTVVDESLAGGGGGSSGASMTTIFHNPFFDIYGAADPAVGPPVGMTTPGSAVEETTIVYPDNPTAQSVKIVTSGAAIGNGCTITPTIQPWGQGSVSVTIPIYTMSSTRSWAVHGYDGTTYTLIGQTALGAPNTWNLIKGTFTPAPGSNWSIIISLWDGASYYSGFQGYIGGVNIVKGVTPANTLEDSLGRRSYTVITGAAPSRAPDFTNESWYDTAALKFYKAVGQTSLADWIALN